MAAKQRKPVKGFRLTPTTSERIPRLARLLNMTETQAVEVAINDVYERARRGQEIALHPLSENGAHT